MGGGLAKFFPDGGTPSPHPDVDRYIVAKAFLCHIKQKATSKNVGSVKYRAKAL